MNHRGIWSMATVLAVIVLLAQIAGASTRDGTASLSTNATVSAERTETAATVSLPEQASSVARERAAENASLTERAEATEKADNDEVNEVVVNPPAKAPKDGTTASGTRPGWGCGDTHHKHSGPPGRPGATPPPGCTKP